MKRPSFVLHLLALCHRSNSWSGTAAAPQRNVGVASRRCFVGQTVIATIMTTTSLSLPTAALAAAPSLEELGSQVKQARVQLAPVPDLIKQEKWDSVRAILITPPLSDCWAKTGRPLLSLYAEALGEAGKDELAALEAREDANSHLRYLDMAGKNLVVCLPDSLLTFHFDTHHLS